MKGKVVILLSGGLDSTTLLNHLKHNLKCESICAITINYGQKHKREIACARWQAQQAKVYEHRV
ncbi:MAG: 7-cyano-7-deazaguanine synthase, partial [Kiritimatiellae bacterium]|nr:7-cyano-7-deazaguanine synthase [Kiritimatiellia bacterium]